MEDGHCAVGVFVDADPGLDVMAAVAAGGDLKCQALVAHRVETYAQASSAPVPRSSAGVAKRALCCGRKTSLRKRLASTMSVMPASLSSWGRRFCKVPNMRSERPLASGE